MHILVFDYNVMGIWINASCKLGIHILWKPMNVWIYLLLNVIFNQDIVSLQQIVCDLTGQLFIL